MSAAGLLVPGSPLRFKKAPEDAADFLYRKALAIQEMQYPQLSQQAKMMTNMILFSVATSGQIRKINPITLKPLSAPFLNPFWHIFMQPWGLLAGPSLVNQLF